MRTPRAVITGGTSGLGLAMAKQLAQQGYAVTVIGRTAKKVDDALVALRTIRPDCDGIRADISCTEGVEVALAHIRRVSSHIDFLILNAGVVHVGALSDQVDMSAMKEDIEIDLWGTILTAKYFSPLLVVPNGRILCTSSALGLMGMAGYSSYCAAKAGVINFASVLRRELLHKKIHVYVACPADIETPQFAHEQNQMPEWMRLSGGGSRPQAMLAEAAASKILRKCRGSRFLILINLEIRLLLLASKVLPRRWLDLILDRVFPVPGK